MPSAPAVRIGTSGWRYPSWRGDFYPRGLPQRRELEYIASRFRSVELNGSFYSLQRPESYRRWRESVPEGFVFAVKGSRYITHMLRLRDVEQALANFFASGVLALGPALGPVLWQLPEREEFDEDVLSSFLRALPQSTGEALALARRHDERMRGRTWLSIEGDVPLRHALEPRAVSYEAATATLERFGVAMAVADTAGRFPRFAPSDADFVYARLHGSRELYVSGYTDAELDAWAERIRGWADAGRDVYAYFDNDAHGHAPHDALRLAERSRLG
ncbi:DUF72 domain-containing protein [Microbacterium sp. CIAB417]|uniref:DUF72 domain-containing protein n=1 Tax=Microbacterium sp. CIAB417 TaxID=2860287 RepID=UPI001FAE0610|nr:DUF72 domain-containing protein [Microbacterium sp. CIAB417]